MRQHLLDLLAYGGLQKVSCERLSPIPCHSRPPNHPAARLHAALTSAAPVTRDTCSIDRSAPASPDSRHAQYSAPLAVVSTLPSARLCISRFSTLYLLRKVERGGEAGKKGAQGLHDLGGRSGSSGGWSDLLRQGVAQLQQLLHPRTINHLHDATLHGCAAAVVSNFSCSPCHRL